MRKGCSRPLMDVDIFFLRTLVSQTISWNMSQDMRRCDRAEVILLIGFSTGIGPV